MIYRKYKKEDFEQVKSLCEKHGLALPVDSDAVFVAEDNAGSIVGVGGIQTVVQVHPLIATNGVVATSLWNHLSGAMQVLNIGSCEAFVDRDNKYLIDLYGKVGFEITETNKIVMEKNFDGK